MVPFVGLFKGMPKADPPLAPAPKLPLIMLPCIALLIPGTMFALGLAPSPGGAVRPGGGPLAVEKGAIVMPFIPGIGPWGDMGVGGPMLPGCPVLTPSGFFEKLKRIPPLTLLCSGWPYNSFRALVAKDMSSNSTKHMGPFCFVRKQRRL